MKRRISASRYRSMLYSDITSYRGASVDVSQSLYLLRDVLKQARLSEAPVKSFGWDWEASGSMTLGQVVERCIEAYGVLFDAVEVAQRVTQGIEHADLCGDASECLSDCAESDGLSELASRHYKSAIEWWNVGCLLRRIAARKQGVPNRDVVMARGTLREADRMKAQPKKYAEKQAMKATIKREAG